MKFCTMCGDGFGDDTQLLNHEHLHRHEGLPVLSVGVAFQKAFQRTATLEEAERIVAGNAEEVFAEASATLG